MIGIEITIIAVVYVFFSVTTQRKLTNPTRTYEIQQIIKEKSKELNELVKNKASQEQMAAKQKEVTALLSESMRSQLKPMFVILPVFLILYYIIFPAVFPSNPNITLFSNPFNYRLYFIIVSFVLGLILSVGMMVYDKIRMSKAQKQAAAESAKEVEEK